MGNWYDARPRRDDGPPTWQPQPGEVLAGVIDRYTISQSPQGLVWTVMVTEARTGEQVRLRLASTSLAVEALHGPPRDARVVPSGWRSVRRGALAPEAARGRCRRRIDAAPTRGRMNPTITQSWTPEERARHGIRGMEDFSAEELSLL